MGGVGKSLHEDVMMMMMMKTMVMMPIMMMMMMMMTMMTIVLVTTDLLQHGALQKLDKHAGCVFRLTGLQESLGRNVLADVVMTTTERYSDEAGAVMLPR